MTYCIINTTTSSEEEAKKIAKHLIEKKLIACCNIIPKITSIYIWNNRLNEDTEALMIMKTKTELYNTVEEEIKKLHSYEVPEIISTNIENGNNKYLSWINDNTDI